MIKTSGTNADRVQIIELAKAGNGSQYIGEVLGFDASYVEKLIAHFAPELIEEKPVKEKKEKKEKKSAGFFSKDSVEDIE